MRKQTIQYTSPLDALVTVAKRLSLYENQQHMDSETLFDQYSRGQLPDDTLLVNCADVRRRKGHRRITHYERHAVL
jgi:hypothetical protein